MENFENSDNPFLEEFDSEDVVNFPGYDDEPDESEIKERLLNDDDIQDIINIDDDARRAVSFLEAFGKEEKWESSVIKKKDAENSDIINADLKELSEFSKKIKKMHQSDDEFEPDIQVDKIKNIEDNPIDEPSEITEYNKEARRKKDSFQDYLKLPKISGRERKFESNKHIPAEAIKERLKKIEIIDDPVDSHQHDKTLVEINRDEFGEIESISIYCKCGEKTLIEFDYLNDEDVNTEIINNEIQEKPFDLKGARVRNYFSDYDETVGKPTDDFHDIKVD